MARTKGTKNDDLQERRGVCEEIIDQMFMKNIPLKRANVIDLMGRSGYPHYNHKHYYTDSEHYAKQDTFVRSLTEGTFSRYIRDMMEALDAMKEDVMDWRENPPQTITQEFEENPDPKKDPILIGSKVETISRLTI